MTQWNPYTPGYFQHPYNHLADCRISAPVQQGIHKGWMLFNYKDVKEVLRSPVFGVTVLNDFFLEKEPLILEKGVCPFLAKGTRKWIMYLNGSEHVQARTLTDAALRQFNFNPVIEQAVEHCFYKNRNEKVLDVVDIATQIPMYIVEEMLGMRGICSYEQLKRFSHLLAISQDLFISKNVYREINEEFTWAFTFFRELYKNAQHGINKNIINSFNTINGNETYRLSEDEMISIITMLFMAALETTKDTMSVLLYEVLKNPDLSRFILAANETEINTLSEELLRYASPLQYTVRVAHEDVSINGHEFTKGTKLFLCLASANRDPEVFPDAERIVPVRKNNPHLAFGSGAHSCLGARVARNEIRSWLKPVTRHLQNFKLTDDAAPVWQKTIFMRGLKSLPISHI